MDVIRATALVWRETLGDGWTWEMARDRPRFQAAFRALAARCRHWPAPRDFLEALPRIQPPRPRTVVRLQDAAAQRAAREHIAALGRQLGMALRGDAAAAGESTEATESPT